MNNTFTGVIPDLRTQEEKNKDWQAEELMGFGAYTWKSLVLDDIPKYPNRDQNGSGMCGPFSAVTALGRNNMYDPNKEIPGIGTWINLDPRFVYKLRANKGPGMNMNDLFQVMCKYGAPEDKLLQGDKLTETQADAFQIQPGMYDEARKYAGKNFVYVEKDIDKIAQCIDMGYTPIILLRCTSAEYTITPTVGENGKKNDINHFLPLVYAGIRDGKKLLVGKESWGAYNLGGFRFITEEFLTNRVEAVGFVVDAPNTIGPKYRFTKPLEYGMKNNPDVVALQDILKFEGCLDQSVPSTGNYLNRTAQAVMALQLKNNISNPANIQALQGRNVGPLTLKYLKKYE